MIAANTVTSAAIASKQFELAKSYFQIARNWRDWFNQAFAPLEDAEIAEIQKETPPVPHYDAAVGRARALAWIASRKAAEKAVGCTSQYEVGLRRRILRESAESLSTALRSASVMGWIDERTRVEVRDDERWARLEQAVSRGRDIAGNNVAYGGLAGGIFARLQAQVGGAVAGIAENGFGFAGERLKTRYPERYVYGRLGTRVAKEGKASFQELSGAIDRAVERSKSGFAGR
jgi:hypothetical protein